MYTIYTYMHGCIYIYICVCVYFSITLPPGILWMYIANIMKHHVTCPLKARIVEPEKTSVAWQFLRKHVSTATKLHGCSSIHTQQ
jgi:hypothetical protein